MSTKAPGAIVINEVMSSNYQLFYDRNGNSSDWVEVRNTGDEPVNLSGWGLSDSDKNPFKFLFPKITIEPGGVLTVFCSGTASMDLKELHAPFKLKASGEKLTLSNSEGVRIDQVTLPVLETNTSYGRPFDSPDSFVILAEPTPKKQNSYELTYKEKTADIKSTITSYWCEEGTELVLYSANKDSIIRYTLDGSEPTVTSPVFSGSITLSKALYPEYDLTTQRDITDKYYPPSVTGDRGLVIRAKAYVHGYYPSSIFTQTIFFTDIKSEHALPIALITLDPFDLMDETDGIYVLGDVFREWQKKNKYIPFDGGSQANYNQRGPFWRRNSYTEFLDTNGGFSTPSVFKILGGWSRSSPQKPFQLFFYERGDTQSGLNYPLFPDLGAKDESGRSTDFYRSIIFRNGGNDYNYTLFRDALIQNQVSKLSIDTQAFRPTVVYLNGEYWGILNMRESHDESYFYRHYGIPLDESVVYEYGGNVRIGDEEDYSWYYNLIGKTREADFTKAETLEQFKDSIDFKNHALYTAIQIYIANKDWPSNNIRFWKTDKTPLRWLLFDTEFSTSIYDQPHYGYNMFNVITEERGPNWPNPPWSVELIKRFLSNPEYKRLLINACCDLMNTVFSEDEITSAVENMIKLYEADMTMHWDRWIWAAGGSMKQWKTNTQALPLYFTQRKPLFQSQMESFFNLEKSVPVSVTCGKGGSVILNNLTLTNESLTGNYYPNQFISLTAVPNEGYTFLQWKGSINTTEKSISVNPEEGLTIQAVFTK